MLCEKEILLLVGSIEYCDTLERSVIFFHNEV